MVGLRLSLTTEMSDKTTFSLHWLQVVCIDLCCPHGEAFLANPDFDYTDYTKPAFTCQQEQQAGTFRPEVRDFALIGRAPTLLRSHWWRA